MLTRWDIAAIHRARERLMKLEQLLEREENGFDHGRLAEACRHADDALLQVLIVAKIRELGVTDTDMAPFQSA
jgi:hypothetical protein